MNRTQTFLLQGKLVFYIDFSMLQTMDEINLVMEDAKLHIKKQPVGSVIALTNIDGMHFNNQIKEKFTEFVKGNKPYIKASAIVGITGLKQIVFNGVMKITGRDIKSFDNLELAKNWLASNN